MNAGDVKAGRPSAEEWLSSPSNDPNAALWASITPPPSPSLSTLLGRRLAALAPDLLAQRLHLRFPQHFASRQAAGRTILGSVAALGASVGLVGYLVVGALLGGPADGAGVSAAGEPAAARAGSEPMIAAERSDATERERLAEAAPSDAAQLRLGQTVADAPAQTLTATAAPGLEQAMQALQPSAEPEAVPRSAASKVKKRAYSKKKPRPRARAKPRARADVATEAAAAPERAAKPPRPAKPRRQPTFKFN
jgi:hypothetical protein